MNILWKAAAPKRFCYTENKKDMASGDIFTIPLFLPSYQEWTDSDYENISFFLSMGMTLWKGGEQLPITQQQNRELKESGVSDMIIHGSVNLEVKIRSLFAMQGLELNYEQTVEERRNQYPKPRDLDKKLKETIAPFRWFSDTGRYSLSLETGLLNEDSFTKSNMLGNGYDWEKTLKEFALAFHKFTMDRNAFEELLERSKSGD